MSIFAAGDVDMMDVVDGFGCLILFKGNTSYVQIVICTWRRP